MRLKQRIGDFRVTELLRDDFLREAGPYRVYRVTKRKIDSLQAAAALAEAAGVEAGDVALAGLKDRQAITVQYMSVRGGKPVSLREREFLIETAGFSEEPICSGDSRGNAFQIVVRALERWQIAVFRSHLAGLRQHGLPNYFDDQRFGNLRHDQGWIARDLVKHQPERALRQLLAAPSPHDDSRHAGFKAALRKHWGDWASCLGDARRHGKHHSIFEHLIEAPEDFAGAFYHVSSKLRLIHLYAYQSHLWNRAVSLYLRGVLPEKERLVVESVEGNLICPAGELPPLPEKSDSFRLPGPGLEDVESKIQHKVLTEVLEKEGLTPEDLHIDGIPGFQLKGEDRQLMVVPAHLRVRPARFDPLNRGMEQVELRFELPRGSYASLVVKRLFARSNAEMERSGRRRSADMGTQMRFEGGGGKRGGEHSPRRTGRKPFVSGKGSWNADNDARSNQYDRSARASGDYQSRDQQRGGYQGGDQQRSGYQGGGQQRGGYQGGDQQRSGYQGGGQQRGGYQGRDQQRGGYQGGDQQRGGYQGRDQQRGGYQGGDQQRGGYQGRDQQRGGYQGGDQQRSGYQGGGQQRGGYQGGGQQRGGYQGRDQQRGGYQGGGQQRGGYQGRDQQRGGYQGGGQQRGGYQGGGQQRGGYQGGGQQRGGYQGRDQQRGGYQGGGQQRGGYQGRDQQRGGYQGGGQQRGGYQGGGQQRGGYQGGDQQRGGYQGRDQQRGGYQGRDQQRGGYQGGDQQRGGYQGGGLGQGEGSWDSRSGSGGYRQSQGGRPYAGRGGSGRGGGKPWDKGGRQGRSGSDSYQSKGKVDGGRGSASKPYGGGGPKREHVQDSKPSVGGGSTDSKSTEE